MFWAGDSIYVATSPDMTCILDSLDTVWEEGSRRLQIEKTGKDPWTPGKPGALEMDG